ncbi:MAG: ATP-binding cassette domain-containing protein [Candidatus Omnitrophica bacterium]|jgi:ATP-binding cassette subfamily F protein 3|nr:ATP-binding cassette domain-containing protein [Candidatus Omnitrophota bacterium]
MIALHSLTKSYGTRDLFKNVSITINRGEKIAFIGPNGAGKSTLFNIVLGVSEATSGSIQFNKNLRIGFLPQESSFHSEHTVLQEIVEGDCEIARLKKEKEELEASNETATKHYGDIVHRLEVLGFFELEYKGKIVLSGLGFKERDFNRPITALSGGWQMRVLLGKLLVCHYDCLLLDEPTNYLDLNAALWFKDYLASYKGTFVMISHDKAFLNEVTNYSIILENGRIAKIKGNYEQYRAILDEQRNHLIKQAKEQERVREQYQRFIDRFHAQPNKASQVRAKKKVLEKMELVVVPEDRRESIRGFHFPPTRPSGHRVIALSGVSKFYGDIQVYKNIDFEIIKNEKAVLAGENGAGKSTLLKILAGVIDMNEGIRTVGHNVTTGYFSQTRMDVLNSDSTVLEEACYSAKEGVTTEAVRTILGAFLFKGDDVEKKVKVLSGGEKSRLILAKLLINPPNFLLLDEPTTHLDVDAVDALIKALTEYEGTIVFISHDIYFVKSVANNVFEVKDGQITKFPGNFEYYHHKKEQDKNKTEESGAKRSLPGGDQRLKAKDQKTWDVGRGTRNEEKKTEKELTPEEIKKHNEVISNKIKKLRKKKEKLELERYAKARVLENPRHGEDLIRYYQEIVEGMDKEIYAIEGEISRWKEKFINT